MLHTTLRSLDLYLKDHPWKLSIYCDRSVTLSCIKRFWNNLAEILPMWSLHLGPPVSKVKVILCWKIIVNVLICMWLYYQPCHMALTLSCMKGFWNKLAQVLTTKRWYVTYCYRGLPQRSMLHLKDHLYFHDLDYFL